MKVHFFTFVIILFTMQLKGQEILDPNYGLKSHSTLDLVEITKTEENTIMLFQLLNLRSDGEFCVDKNTVLILPNGKELQLEKTNGIPTCPETHKFDHANEELNFTLTFPPIPESTKSIDIIEKCENNCFSFLAVVIDEEINEYLNVAYSYYQRGLETESINQLTQLLDSGKVTGTSLEGSIYTSIIAAYISMGNQDEAKRWVNKLKLSETKYKEEYLRNVETIGIDKNMQITD